MNFIHSPATRKAEAIAEGNGYFSDDVQKAYGVNARNTTEFEPHLPVIPSAEIENESQMEQARDSLSKARTERLQHEGEIVLRQAEIALLRRREAALEIFIATMQNPVPDAEPAAMAA